MNIRTRACSVAVSTMVSWLLLGSLLTSAGCATSPYRFGTSAEYYTSRDLAAIQGSQVERGKPNAFVDAFGWVWGIPPKILFWDRRFENHRIDSHTESEVLAYLNDNELSTVKVRLNQYHPGDDWKRLVANKSVGAGWRYTLGAVSVLGETIVPGRLFGGDHYNPFTNTIHLYSNHPAIAMHEAGHARDFARRNWKGTYAAAYLLPLVPLYHEAQATNDALGYVVHTRDLEAQQEAYEILYPAYGSYLGSALTNFTPVGYLAGIIGGHVAGQYKSAMIARNYRQRHEHLQQRTEMSSPAVSSADPDFPQDAEFSEDQESPQEAGSTFNPRVYRNASSGQLRGAQ